MPAPAIVGTLMNADWPIFQFETDFAGTLHCIPMCVRFKLTRAGHDNDNFIPAMREFGLVQ